MSINLASEMYFLNKDLSVRCGYYTALWVALRVLLAHVVLRANLIFAYISLIKTIHIKIDNLKFAHSFTLFVWNELRYKFFIVKRVNKLQVAIICPNYVWNELQYRFVIVFFFFGCSYKFSIFRKSKNFLYYNLLN